MDDLKWFIAVMGLLFVGWLVSGGPTRYSSTKPFIRPPQPLDTGEVYGPSNPFSFFQPAPVIQPTYPDGWQQVNTQYFTFYTPDGWRVREINSDDTYRGEITNGNTVITFDFGKDTNPLSFEGNPRYTINHEDIGTYDAKIVMPAGGTSGTTGAYYKKLFKKYTLTMTGENLTKKEQTTALTIFRSVRFKIVR